jgi:cysteine-rich repeat protein
MVRSALLVLTIGLTATLASTEARAATTTCTGWDTGANWGSAGYAVVNAALRLHTSPTTFVIVEVSTDDDVLETMGTFSVGADWDTAPLSGEYSVAWTITIYSGLNHVGTPEELASWPADRTFRLNTASGKFNCVPPPPEPICGDGTVDADEDCDDGNNTSGDGCSADCYEEVCGNAIVDVQEQCDDGNTLSADGCSSTCTVEICGNAVIDAGEACDDGNVVNNDGCSSSCTLEFCGDGMVQGTEQCDDGNTLPDDGCSASCALEECGNGLLEGSEECDDANMVGGDGCSGTCTLEYCGNSITEGSEQCDDGNNLAGDGCTPECTVEVCGNGVTDLGEACDDGNTEGGDGCSASCTIEVCGNGILEGSEQCDDGNSINGDGCSSACVVEPPPPPPNNGCTKSVGWWKTHNNTERGSRDIPWPISENTRVCSRKWLDILETSPRGNAWYILAHQWIGARLNVANGASTTPDVVNAINRATNLLNSACTTCSIRRIDRDLATDLASVLEAYNVGQTGPGSCEHDNNSGCNNHHGHRHHRSGYGNHHRHGRGHGHSHRHHWGCGHWGW